jgi:hypothetical protein
LWSDHLEKCERASSTKDVIEAVRLGVFTPPGSPFGRNSVVVFTEHE